MFSLEIDPKVLIYSMQQAETLLLLNIHSMYLILLLTECIPSIHMVCLPNNTMTFHSGTTKPGTAEDCCSKDKQLPGSSAVF